MWCAGTISEHVDNSSGASALPLLRERTDPWTFGESFSSRAMPGFEHDQAWFGQSEPATHRAPSRLARLPGRGHEGRRLEAPSPRARPASLSLPMRAAAPWHAQPSSRSRSSALCGGTSSRRCSAARRATRARRSGSARRRPTCGDQRSCAHPTLRPCTTGEQRRVSARGFVRLRLSPLFSRALADPRAWLSMPASRRTRLCLGNPACASPRSRKCDGLPAPHEIVRARAAL